VEAKEEKQETSQKRTKISDSDRITVLPENLEKFGEVAATEIATRKPGYDQKVYTMVKNGSSWKLVSFSNGVYTFKPVKSDSSEESEEQTQERPYKRIHTTDSDRMLTVQPENLEKFGENAAKEILTKAKGYDQKVYTMTKNGSSWKFLSFSNGVYTFERVDT
jgi:hypothetical protein